MTEANRIDGKAFAEGLRATLAVQTAALKASHGLVPGLAAVLVGEDAASQVYVRNKEKQCVEVGMNSVGRRLDATTSQADLLALIAALNADPTVHGILVQLPLPDQIDARAVIEAIDPAKDVDGFHPVNVGRLSSGEDSLVPCTPQGCMMLLEDVFAGPRGDLAGANAVVVGRSNIVGKPIAQLLLAANCTVTIAHSRTRDLPTICRGGDILIAAVGQPRMIEGDWIKPGATVIDVGINRIEAEGGKTRLVGDVDYDAAVQVAGAITPVPGGVGPMTIACLLRNTLIACCRQNEIDVPTGSAE